VMRCILRVPLKQIEADEMGLLVRHLSSARSIGAGQSEEILACVMDLMTKLVSSDSAGRTFVSDFADAALSQTYYIFGQNTRRDTSGNIDEEKQKHCLSLAAVRFFMECSKHKDLRPHMRTLQGINQILKEEELYHRPLAGDVAIEQTWLGRSMSNLASCLAGEHLLDRRKKVAFRVLSRMADIVEGRHDLFMKRREGWSLIEISERERRMWPPDDGHAQQKLRFLDDQELLDRESEVQGWAIVLKGVSLVINFMSGGDELSRFHRTQRDEYAKSLTEIQNLFSYAKTRSEKIIADQETVRNDSRIPTVPLEQYEDKNPYRHTSGRDVLMISMQRHEEWADAKSEALFGDSDVRAGSDASADEVFTKVEDVFEDVAKGHLNRALPLAAMLRLFMFLIVVAPNEEVRLYTISVLRRPYNIGQLLALLDMAHPLSCNVAAKFFRLMSATLDVGVFNAKTLESSRYEGYCSLCSYAGRLSSMILDRLRQTADKRLTFSEQALCAELLRLLVTVARVLPYLKNDFGTLEVVQSECVGKCFDILIPPNLIRLAIAATLYEMQADCCGGFGDDVSEKYVHQLSQKTDTRTLGQEFLSEYMVWCPWQKYDILEAFNVAQVFNNMEVRPSFMQALLTDTSLSLFRRHVEKFLNESQGEAQDVRQIALVEVDRRHRVQRGSILVPHLLVVSSIAIYLLRPSSEPPPYVPLGKGGIVGSVAHVMSAQHVWEPRWEEVLPRELVFCWRHSFSDIQCIYRLYGKNLMAIEWRESSQPTDTGYGLQRMFGSGQDASAPCREVFGFHRSSDREAFLYWLRRRTGAEPAQLSQRQRAGGLSTPGFHVHNDPGVRDEISKIVGEDVEVLIASLARYQSDESCLILLTRTQFVICKIDMAAWRVPNINDCFFDEDEFAFRVNEDSDGEHDIARLMEHTTSTRVISNSATRKQLMDTMLRKHMERTLPQFQRGATTETSQQTSLFLHKIFGKDMPPRTITFEPTAEPNVTLDFVGKKVLLTFFTDAERELFRRALAYYFATATRGKDVAKWERRVCAE